MVTARSHDTARVRRPSAGLLRVLGLTLLLLGLLWTHGTDAHGTGAHGAPTGHPDRAATAAPATVTWAAAAPTAAASSTAASAVSTSALPPVDSHGAAHSGHECDPLTPRQVSLTEAAPCGLPPAPRYAEHGGPYAHTGSRDRAPLAPPSPARASTVLLI
ncbi:hypothetical protein [Streptomyces sp. RerS4]|uniref:hypothetical protein n=1 Tax=Streptomyces sp. RerS4 TaxID=2942449 RepID=UPI00201C4017|nr:hypothetical protein [Streptomyces sp. RerS4]UQW99672.1 hypothetical protein M4D82_03305 [Streptomyces sp. RerS4]